MILPKCLDMWHTSISWHTFLTSWIFQFKFHKSFCTLWFSYCQLLTSSFRILCFVLFICSSLFYVSLEASSLDVEFSLVFHYNHVSKLESSNTGSSLVFDNCTSKETQCSWSAQSRRFESVVWLWIWLWKSVGRMSRVLFLKQGYTIHEIDLVKLWIWVSNHEIV